MTNFYLSYISSEENKNTSHELEENILYTYDSKRVSNQNMLWIPLKQLKKHNSKEKVWTKALSGHSRVKENTMGDKHMKRCSV